MARGAVRTVGSAAGAGGAHVEDGAADAADAGAGDGGGGGGATAGRAAVADVAARGGPSAAPQWTQNLVPGWLSFPQTAQFIDVRFAGA